MANERYTPSFLEARTKEELRSMMWMNNQRHGRKLHYFDFGFAKGKFHCWFESPAFEQSLVKGLDGDNS